MASLGDRLYISTIAGDAPQLAREYGLGLEIADYCTAWNMDEHFPETDAKVSALLPHCRDVTLHAPFSELCPAAIDPKVRELTRERYRQAMNLAAEYGAKKLVIHSGFIPTVYFREWFTEQSVCFWRELMPEVPPDMTVCLENVMEPAPDMLCEIVREVEHPRLRLCLDVGHAYTELVKAPLSAWLEQMRPYISHVHLHDNKGGWDTHQCLGDGTIPMEETLQMLLSMDNSITFTIENMEARASVEWLKEHRFL